MTYKDIKRIRTVLLTVLLLTPFVAVAVITWATGAWTSGNVLQQTVGNARVAESVEKLERVRQKYAAARSVHLLATAQISFFGANPRSGSGSYEYWAEGNRYKMKIHADARLGLSGDVEIAYDGNRFYSFNRASGVLAYQREEAEKNPSPFANPLFLQLLFLSNEGDDCRLCGHRWKDLKSPNPKWEMRASAAEIKSTGRDAQKGHSLTELEMPGGSERNRAFKLRVVLAETADGKSRVIRMNRIFAGGSAYSSYTFDNFAASELGDFPQTIKVEGFDDNSELLARIEYTIRTLEINHPIENANFKVSFDDAPAVWDGDARRFVKEKPAKSRP